MKHFNDVFEKDLASKAFGYISKALDGEHIPDGAYTTSKSIQAKDFKITFSRSVKIREVLEGVDRHMLNNQLARYGWQAEIRPVHDQRANPNEIHVILREGKNESSPPDESQGIPIGVWIDGRFYLASYSDTACMFAIEVGNKIEMKSMSDIDYWVVIPKLEG